MEDDQPVRVSHHNSPKLIFKCISWQDDTILDSSKVVRKPILFGICGINDFNYGWEPDIVIIQFRYQFDGLDLDAFTCYFWIRKIAIVDSEMYSYYFNEIKSKLSKMFAAFKLMNTIQGFWVESDMIQEVIDFAYTLLNMPRNAGRDNLCFVYDIRAYSNLIEYTIDSLDKVKFVDDIPNSETQICVICLNEISHDDEVIWMPSCSHVFHGNCIVPWLTRKQTCPTCRMPLPLEEPSWSLASSYFSFGTRFS